MPIGVGTNERNGTGNGTWGSIVGKTENWAGRGRFWYHVKGALVAVRVENGQSR